MKIKELVAQIKPDTCVLAVRYSEGVMADPANLSTLHEEISATLGREIVILVLPEGLNVEVLNAKQMARAGWVRANDG